MRRAACSVRQGRHLPQRTLEQLGLWAGLQEKIVRAEPEIGFLHRGFEKS